MQKTRLLALAGLGAVAFAAGTADRSATAQDFGGGPTIRELVNRVENQDVLFGVSVGAEVTDDLFELGRLVAMGGAGNIASGAACLTCHGADGAGDGSGAIPRLAGLPGWYMYKQLGDYASGARPNQIMSGIASRLSREQMEAVSAYYAAMDTPFPPVVGEVEGAALQWGAQLGMAGSAEAGIPACVNCHGPSGTGNPPSVPYLAGQYASYMSLQLELWKDGTRANDPLNVMSTIAAKMTPEDMRAVSEYYARVRPPEREVLGGASGRVTAD